MKNGGKRTGAGRPKGSIARHTLLKSKMRERLIDTAYKRQDEISTALLDSALGHFKEAEIKDEFGKVIGTRVYKKSPTPESLFYLLDQVIDRAVQHVDLKAEGDTTDAPVNAEALAIITQAIRYALPENRRESSKSRKPD